MRKTKTTTRLSLVMQPLATETNITQSSITEDESPANQEQSDSALSDLYNSPHSWAEIGAMMDPPISASVARKIGNRAIRKLKRALVAQGITEEVFATYMHMKDEARTARDFNSAVLPVATVTKDDADPKPHRSLRRT